jgi:hypothetical protein
MGDEYSKAFDFHQADLVHVHTHTHGRQVIHFTNYVGMGQGNSLRYLQIDTNLLMKNKIVPISQLGCLLNRSRNSHKSKRNVAGYTTKIAIFRKVLWFMNKNTYMLHENLNCNGLVVVMGKYLNSTRFVFHYM